MAASATSSDNARVIKGSAGGVRGSIAGSWRYTQHCSLSGNWTGEINLKGPSQHITGSVAIDQSKALTDDNIIDGQVSGDDVVLTRRFTNPFGTYTQTWTAKLSDSEKFVTMSGTISYSMESCSFTATSSSPSVRKVLTAARPAPASGGAALRLVASTPDDSARLLKFPVGESPRGAYKLDQEYDFNILDDVYYDEAARQISLIGHRDERYKGPRIPYLQHLATLLEVTKPEFTLNMTPESLRQIDTFFKTTLSTEQADKMAKQLGAVVDQSGNITALGRSMLPALGLYPTPNNTPVGYLGVTASSFVSPKSKYAKIETVAANSPAAQIGLRPGDLIFVMNGAWTYSADELNHLTRFNGAGTTVGLAYVKRDNLYNVTNATVTLAADPNPDPWASLNAYDALIAIYREAGYQDRAIAIDAMRKLKNDRKPWALEHYFGLMEALGLAQEARQFANNNMNSVNKGQAIAFGRLFSERLDTVFGLPGSPSVAAFNANLAQGKNAGVAQQAALDQFDRSNVPQVAALLDRFFKRPAGVQVPPELVATIYNVRPEMTPDFLGVPANSLLARAMFDGDYLMKRLNNRPDLKAKIPAYQTEFEFKRNNPQFRRKESTTRQWISVAKLDAAQSPASDTLELRDVKMRINIREHNEVNGAELPNVPGGYEELLTSLYDEFSIEYPTLHELSEAAKLSAAAAWLRAKNPSLRLPKDGAVQWNAPAKVPGLMYVYYSTDSDGPKITKVAMGGVNLEPFNWARPQLSTDSSVVDLRGTAAGGPMPQGAPLVPIDSSIVDLRTSNGGDLVRPPAGNPAFGWVAGASVGSQDRQSVSIVIEQIRSLNTAEAERALGRRDKQAQQDDCGAYATRRGNSCVPDLGSAYLRGQKDVLDCKSKNAGGFCASAGAENIAGCQRNYLQGYNTSCFGANNFLKGAYQTGVNERGTPGTIYNLQERCGVRWVEAYNNGRAGVPFQPFCAEP